MTNQTETTTQPRRKRRRKRKQNHPLTFVVLLMLFLLSAPYAASLNDTPEISVNPSPLNDEYEFKTQWNYLDLTPMKESSDKIPEHLRK